MNKQLKIKELGSVGVDSGQVLICDPCYIDSEWKETDEKKDLRHPDHKEQFSYGGCCEATLGSNQGGQLTFDGGYRGAGVASSSGFGDGHYPVYAIYNDDEEDRRIAMLIVDFQVISEEKRKEIFDILSN